MDDLFVVWGRMCCRMGDRICFVFANTAKADKSQQSRIMPELFPNKVSLRKTVAALLIELDET